MFMSDLILIQTMTCIVTEFLLPRRKSSSANTEAGTKTLKVDCAALISGERLVAMCNLYCNSIYHGASCSLSPRNFSPGRQLYVFICASSAVNHATSGIINIRLRIRPNGHALFVHELSFRILYVEEYRVQGINAVNSREC